MIKYFRVFTILLMVIAATGAMAQSTATTSSPYSRFGLGTIDQPLLPQTTAMGGIATAINRIGGFNNINMLNPASYASINLTVIDIGLYSNQVTLNQTGSASQHNSNFRLSHVAFGIPLSSKSAFSFGLTPYSELGYSYRKTSTSFGTSSAVDTNHVDYIYSGDGGLSKAYIGYGFTPIKGLSIGANVSYIFGNLHQYQSTELPLLYGAFNTRIEQTNAVGGVNYDLGAQYSIELSDIKHLVFGYSNSLSTNINTSSRYIVSQYTTDYTTSSENLPLDTVTNKAVSNGKIKLPQINHFGVSYQKDRYYLVGVDYTMGKWSDLSIAGVNQGLQNSNSLAIGGQITPNPDALSSYWALVDYRAGAHFDKTYIYVGNTSIKQFGVSAGLGLPLARNGSSFYKINVSAEYGQRGTVANGLVRENYFNFHLGFTLNDKWFTRYKFD